MASHPFLVRGGALSAAACSVALALAAACGGDDASNGGGPDGATTDGGSPFDGTGGPHVDATSGDAGADAGADSGVDATSGDAATIDGPAPSDARATDAFFHPDGPHYCEAGAPPSSTGSFTVDSTYGSAGFTPVNFGAPGDSRGQAIARQADGKLVVAGDVTGAIVVERFLVSGPLDPAFGSGGTVFFPTASSVAAVAVLVQTTGGIVVVTADGRVVRFDASGALDTSFGTQGITKLAGPASGAALQTDDSVLVVINVFLAVSNTSYIARLLPDGTLDSSFHGGYVTVGSPNLHAVVEQKDGNVVVAGNTASTFQLYMQRLTPTGSNDVTFGDGGVVNGANDGGSNISAIAQEPDGKLVVAGYYGGAGVGRYAPSGAADTTFGGSGWTPLRAGDAGWIQVPSGVAVQPDERILASGVATLASPGVARLAPDGGDDTTFGQGGLAAVPLSPIAVSAELEPDAGRIGVAGSVADNAFALQDLAVTKLGAGGAVDPSFGNGGVAVTPIGGSDDEGLALAVQPNDGTAVVAGSVVHGTSVVGGGLARLSTGGALDTSFAGTGKTYVASTQAPRSVVVQSTGRIVVGSAPANGPWTIGRYTAAGTVDGTFGASGVATIAGGAGQAIALGPGDVVAAVGGYGPSRSGRGFWIAELTPDGQPAPGFGAGGDAGPGAVTTPASTFVAGSAVAMAAAVQPDGEIVAAGTADWKIALARYTTSGALDPSFNTSGVTTLDPGGGEPTVPYAVAVQPDGAIVVVSITPNESWLVVTRFFWDGTPDCSFGDTRTHPIPVAASTYVTGVWAQAPIGLALAGDGRIYVAATQLSASGAPSDVLLLRFTTYGFLDAKSTFPLGPGASIGHALALQGDGKVLVAGRTWTPAGGYDFFVARFSPPP